MSKNVMPVSRERRLPSRYALLNRIHFKSCLLYTSVETKQEVLIIHTIQLEVEKLDIGRHFLLQNAVRSMSQGLLRHEEERNRSMVKMEVQTLVESHRSLRSTQHQPQGLLIVIILSQRLIHTKACLLYKSSANHCSEAFDVHEG